MSSRRGSRAISATSPSAGAGSASARRSTGSLRSSPRRRPSTRPFRACCRRWRRAWTGSWGPRGSSTTTPAGFAAAHCGEANRSRRASSASSAGRLVIRRGVGPLGRVWSSGRPSSSEDAVQEPGYPRAEAAAREGLHGALWLPIGGGAEVFGVIEFYSRRSESPRRRAAENAGDDRKPDRRVLPPATGRGASRPPGAPRPSHRSAQPHAAARSSRAGAGALQATRVGGGRAVHGHRRLQADQRQPRASRRRRAPGAVRRPDASRAAHG